MSAFSGSRDIATRRAFKVPPERLWEALIDPGALARWWGPSGFTNVFQAFDPRAGGEWRFIMRGPDGTEYPMRKVFVEVEAPARFVFDHPDPVHGHRLSIHLRAAGEGTEVSWTMRFDSAEEAERVRAFVEPANEQNLDRLADYLSRAPRP
jgi:uncharacterized protein YndB with AHSA1/START domain